MESYLPIFIYFVAVLGFAGVSLLAPHVVAPRKRTVVKDMPYESGMDPTGDARKPLDVKFYLIAILFLIFDIELLLIYPYVVALRADGGIPLAFRPLVLGVMVLLLATLALAYVLAWRRGVFQWRSDQRPDSRT
jgi:NADH-quinone oxidoreductase subunit A